MPALGFGTFKLRGEACTAMVRRALELGYRHLDTAEFYGNEAEVGRGLAEAGVPRAEVWLTTKVWVENLAPADLVAAAEASLARLGQDYVDLLLLHWPSDRVPLGDSLEALAGLRAAGRARHIGVSNFPVAQLREAVEVHCADLLCDQVEYHPLLSQRRVGAFLRAHGMILTAYSPLARGQVLEDPALVAIGARHGKSAAQVALRWLLDQEGVAVIPKASTEAHARANLEVFDFALDDEDRAAIVARPKDQRQISPAWGPTWDPE